MTRRARTPRPRGCRASARSGRSWACYRPSGWASPSRRSRPRESARTSASRWPWTTAHRARSCGKAATSCARQSARAASDKRPREMPPPSSNLHKFDHLVVLMMENRSFDHLLGFLYEDGEPAHFIPDDDRAFRGVAGRDDLYNLDDSDPPRRVCVSRAPYETLDDMTRPFPDPGEELPNVIFQMFGVDDTG